MCKALQILTVRQEFAEITKNAAWVYWHALHLSARCVGFSWWERIFFSGSLRRNVEGRGASCLDGKMKPADASGPLPACSSRTHPVLFCCSMFFSPVWITHLHGFCSLFVLPLFPQNNRLLPQLFFQCKGKIVTLRPVLVWKYLLQFLKLQQVLITLYCSIISLLPFIHCLGDLSEHLQYQCWKHQFSSICEGAV